MLAAKAILNWHYDNKNWQLNKKNNNSSILIIMLVSFPNFSNGSGGERGVKEGKSLRWTMILFIANKDEY